jgi:Uncharacterized conserved protein
VGESSGSTGADFHLGGHSKFPTAKNDGGDIRFTDNDGTTLLPFWVEEVSGSSPNRVAKVWVKVKDDLGSNVDIYCYYGNSSATNYSNGANTFIFFDDASSDNSSRYTLRNLYNSALNATLSWVSGVGYKIDITSNDEIMAEINTLTSGGAYRIKCLTKVSSISANVQMGFCMRYSASGVYYGRFNC